MNPPPTELDGAKVHMWSPIDSRHKKTNSVRLYADGSEQISFSGIALAQYEDKGNTNDGVYIFYCDSTWEVLNDSLYGDIVEAKSEAERQFDGVSDTWHKI